MQADDSLTSALIDWTADYPGDLADIVTQSLFRQILQLLLKYTFMAHLTVSLAEVEATISDFRDIDSSWAIKLSESTISLKSTQSELAINEGILYDLESPLDKSEEVLTPLTREHSASVRTTSTTSLNLDNMRNGSGSLGTGSLQDERMVKSIDEAGSKWSGALGFVLNTDPKVFAAELTKRQWQLFAAIRVCRPCPCTCNADRSHGMCSGTTSAKRRMTPSSTPSHFSITCPDGGPDRTCYAGK